MICVRLMKHIIPLGLCWFHFSSPSAIEQMYQMYPQTLSLHSESLTLYTEAEFLLLVGDVAADCTHQCHRYSANNPSNGANLSCCP